MDESDNPEWIKKWGNERSFPRPLNNLGVRLLSDVESNVMSNRSSNVITRMMNECDSVLSVVLHSWMPYQKELQLCCSSCILSLIMNRHWFQCDEEQTCVLYAHYWAAEKNPYFYLCYSQRDCWKNLVEHWINENETNSVFRFFKTEIAPSWI